MKSHEKGVSLVEMLIVVALMGILVLFVMRLNSDGLRGAHKARLSQDLEMVKQTIRTRLDCRQTLGVGPSTPLPVACPSSIVLRDMAGNSITSGGGTLGEWTLQVNCGSEIIVGATRPGNDPLSGKPFSSAPTATDVFRGASDFCREYLDAAYAKPRILTLSFDAKATDATPCGNVDFGYIRTNWGRPNCSSRIFWTDSAYCPSGYVMMNITADIGSSALYGVLGDPFNPSVCGFWPIGITYSEVNYGGDRRRGKVALCTASNISVPSNTVAPGIVRATCLRDD